MYGTRGMSNISVTDDDRVNPLRTIIFRVVVPIQSYPYRMLMYACMTTNAMRVKIMIYGSGLYIIHSVYIICPGD
jgi:hypothetical protein